MRALRTDSLICVASEARSCRGTTGRRQPRQRKLLVVNRDLEYDLKALADRARPDRDFAVEFYGSLCNAEWRHDDGSNWPGATWRSVADLVAHLRSRGEGYLDFYCSGGEGEISVRVADAMAELGWHGIGHGAPLRKVDLRTGESQVLGEDGEWIVERPASG